jgi:hypothetical protein
LEHTALHYTSKSPKMNIAEKKRQTRAKRATATNSGGIERTAEAPLRKSFRGAILPQAIEKQRFSSRLICALGLRTGHALLSRLSVVLHEERTLGLSSFFIAKYLWR